MRFYKEVWGIIWEFNSIDEYISFCAGRVLAWVLVIGAFLIWAFFIHEPTPEAKAIIEDNSKYELDRSKYDVYGNPYPDPKEIEESFNDYHF